MRLLFFLILGVFILLPANSLYANEKNTDVGRLETVRLQLKWFHAFQFAGYYAAKQQGYYANEGLDVHILERNPKLNIVKQVISNDVQYAVEDTGIIAEYANGVPIIALAAIFQHNPLVFVSKQSSGIISPYEMAGKRIMMYGDDKEGVGADEAPLRALLADAGLNKQKFTHVRPSFDDVDLIKDKVDVMAAYLTDQPYFFKKRRVKINIINPQNYGFDFYGDILFTSQAELTEHPTRVQRFRRASLKGWQYALDHPEQIIQLIHKKYHSRSSIKHLRFEAKQTRKLILPDIIPLGQIEVKRLHKVADTYTALKIARHLSHAELAAFIFSPPQSINLSLKEQRWLEQNPVVRLGIDRNFAPYEWMDETGQYAGITVDYIRLLERRLGIRFDIIEDKETWPELLDAAKKNELDMLFSLIKTPDRSAYLNFTAPYFVSPAVIISGQAQGYIGSLQRLIGKQVAIQKGHSTQELLAKYYPKINTVSTDSIAEALHMVAQGQVHAYVGDATSASYIMNKKGIFELMFSGQTEYESEFRIAIPKHKPELLAIMEKALASISQEERNEIYSHWQELDVIQGIQLQTIAKYALFIALLFALFLYWIQRLRRSESALRRSETNLKAIFDAELECVKVISAEGTLLQINPAGLALFEVDNNSAALLGSPAEELIIPENRQAFREMNERVYNGETGLLTYQIESLKGRRRWIETQAVPLLDPESGQISILAVARDITDKKQADDKIWKQAKFDSLTNLPNRVMFHDYLNHEIKVSHRNNWLLALLFLDLDHFKDVNDELGHQIGDQLLQEAARRITACVRETDIVSRLSGDEFTIILSELEDKEISEHITEKIINTLNQPFKLGDDIVHVSASIGIAIYPDDSKHSAELIKFADQAMYTAKASGRNRFNYFTQPMQAAALYRQQLLNELRSAIQEEQFQLHYQPIIDLANGHCDKVEALLCWNHPTRDFVRPAEFIPLAEESGLIVEIGDWVFKEAIRQLSLWQKTFNNDIKISINKSTIQFNISDTHYDWLHLLDEYALNGEHIIIEIAEELLNETSESITQRLSQYRAKGIQIAIDDFGTGYSALSKLSQFTIDYLKIDHSLIHNLSPGSGDQLLIEAIIAMAHKLGVKVIAEGVETDQQQQLLSAAGCDYAQGYLFHRPMSAEQLELILQKS